MDINTYIYIYRKGRQGVPGFFHRRLFINLLHLLLRLCVLLLLLPHLRITIVVDEEQKAQHKESSSLGCKNQKHKENQCFCGKTKKTLEKLMFLLKNQKNIRKTIVSAGKPKKLKENQCFC